MRSLFKPALAALALCAVALPAMAQTTVSEAWARATVANQQSSGAFMTLTADSDSKLVAVRSPVARTVQVHEMKMNGDVMTMGPVDFLALPAGKAVVLDDSGYHVMLMGLNRQLKEGEQVPLTLVVEDAKGERQSIEVQAPVRALNAAGGHSMHHDHGNM